MQQRRLGQGPFPGFGHVLEPAHNIFGIGMIYQTEDALAYRQPGEFRSNRCNFVGLRHADR